jgi:hypothetical protein
MHEDQAEPLSGRNVVRALTGQAIAAGAGRAAMSVDGPHRSQVSDFDGSSSESRELPDGTFEFVVVDRPLWGDENEPNVLRTLAKALAEQGAPHAAERHGTEADNRAGIDGWIDVPGEDAIAVQVTMAPSGSDFGRDVARGHCRRVVDATEAAGWLVKAIERKVTSVAPNDRPRLLLALDARHAGQLVNERILAEFRRQRPDIAQLGFRAVWLVGSTPIGSRRLA